jgi:hypothetical protein
MNLVCGTRTDAALLAAPWNFPVAAWLLTYGVVAVAAEGWGCWAPSGRLPVNRNTGRNIGHCREGHTGEPVKRALGNELNFHVVGFTQKVSIVRLGNHVCTMSANISSQEQLLQVHMTRDALVPSIQENLRRYG